jgi:hypothetical protein
MGGLSVKVSIVGLELCSSGLPTTSVWPVERNQFMTTVLATSESLEPPGE